MKLLTSLAALDELYKLADGKGNHRKVSREALQRLVMDHSKMYGRLVELGEKMEDSNGAADKH